MVDSLQAFRESSSSPRRYYEQVETSCPVCLEEFNETTTIPRHLYYCAHLVCHRCLIEMHRQLKLKRTQGSGPTVKAMKCPLCKVKARPHLDHAIQPSDRLTLALVGAVKEVQCLGKRLKTETPGLTFCKIKELLEQGADMTGVDPAQQGSKHLPIPAETAADPLQAFRTQDDPVEMVRAAEASIEIRESCKFVSKMKDNSRIVVTICMQTGSIKVMKLP